MKNSTLKTDIVADNTKFVNACNQAKTSAQSLGRAVETSMSKATASLRNFALGFVGLNASINFLRGINTATISFTKSLADLSAITGATGKDLEYLAEQSRNLGSSTLFNATQVAEALKLVGAVKADLLSNLPALKEVTAQVINLATASGVDLATAAKTVGSALNQFGADSDQAAKFVNVLAAGSRFGAAEVDDLGESLKYVGPVASNLGLSIEETVASIELLAQAGIKGSEAGTGLRQVLLHLSKSSDGNINPTVVGLSKALENLSKMQLSTAKSSELFGINAVASGVSLVKFQKQLVPMTKSLTNTNTATEQSNIILGSYAAQVDKLSAAFQNLQIGYGESFSKSGIIPAITNDVKELTAAVKEYGIVEGTVRGVLEASPLGKAIKYARDKITPETGDAGITSPVTFASKAQDIAFRGKELLRTGRDPVQDRLANLIGEWTRAIKQVTQPTLLNNNKAGPVINVSTELTKLASAAVGATAGLKAVATSALKDVLGISPTSGKDYLSKILSPQKADFQDASFTSIANDVRDLIAGGADIKSVKVQSGLASLNSIANSYGSDPNGAILKSAAQALMDANGQMNQNKEVKIKIEYDQNGIIKAVIDNPGVTAVIQDASKALAANEAQATGF